MKMIVLEVFIITPCKRQVAIFWTNGWVLGTFPLTQRVIFIILHVKNVKGNPRKGIKHTHLSHLYFIYQTGTHFPSQNRTSRNPKCPESANDTRQPN